MLIGVLSIIGLLFGVFIAFLIAYTITKTLIIILKCRFKNIKKNIKETRYINTIEFIKWVLIDLKRGKDYFKLFGIWCFTGYYGQGKSLGAVNFAFDLREKYAYKNIKIFSNFNIKGQDGKITKWQDLLNLPKNSIVIFDEIQSTFTSQKYAEFPLDLLWKLTQCRKHGLTIFGTSPVYKRMTIQLRESTDYVIECKNIFKLDRHFKYEFYHAPDYESYIEVQGGIMDQLKKKKFLDRTYNLVAQDKNYHRYDTEEQIDRWDIEDANQKTKSSKNGKPLSRNDYQKLRDQLIKEIDTRYKLEKR